MLTGLWSKSTVEFRAVGAGAAGAAMAAPLFVASPSQTLLCASERERRGKTNTYKEAFNLKPD